jgi:hypothetical protein
MSQTKRLKAVVGLGGIVFGVVRSVSELRAARGKKDTLALLNALVNLLSAGTGAALVLRSLRKDGEDE